MLQYESLLRRWKVSKSITKEHLLELADSYLSVFGNDGTNVTQLVRDLRAALAELLGKEATEVTRIAFLIYGECKGFQMPGETLEQARCRILLDVEMHGNDAMKSRVHLWVQEGPSLTTKIKRKLHEERIREEQKDA